MSWMERVGLAVIILALVREIWVIRKHLNLDDWTPTRRWKKQFDANRREPIHQLDRVPLNAEPDDLRFFHDTSMIVHWLNDIYKDTPWSFESTGELEESFASENGAERKIKLWYNQVKTGRISISKIRMKTSTVYVKFSLINSRMYPGLKVHGIADSLAQLVSKTPEEIREARDQIQTVMIDNVWQLGTEFGNSELEFHFTGQLKDHLLPSSSFWH